jgi:excisionase family DNA binding protein
MRRALAGSAYLWKSRFAAAVKRGIKTVTRHTTVNHRAHRLQEVANAPYEQQATSHTAQAAQGDQRLTLTIPETCEALGIGETMLRQIIRAGRLPILKIGRRVLIPRQAVEQLVAEACIDREGSSGEASLHS